MCVIQVVRKRKEKLMIKIINIEALHQLLLSFHVPNQLSFETNNRSNSSACALSVLLEKSCVVSLLPHLG